MYTVEELLDERNRDLHALISKHVKIVLAESGDAYWHVKVSEGVATIETAPSEWPGACFAHELLHVARRIQGAVCPQFIDNEGIDPALIAYLFNLFEHVQIYGRFLELGYPAEQFAADADEADVDDVLERDLPSLETAVAKGESVPHIVFAVLYAAIETPPPHPRRTEYRDRLAKVAPAQISANIPGLIDKLSSYNGTDLRHVFGYFFKICNMPRIGFSNTGTKDDMIVAGNL